MTEFDIYRDIAERTSGDIYVGVVGPVRTGKSTFITRFMEALVVPSVKNKSARERMRDELPQSANGRAIMTTQPKFVPSEAVSVNLRDDISVQVRLVDCVGYLIEGAVGHVEEGRPRMVRTPWSEQEMPFEEAADFGTRKVIAEHSTIGIVMTTDGSIGTELPRAAYVAAEERVVKELAELGKPFVIILNSTVPTSAETAKLATQLEQKYSTAVIALNVAKMTEADIASVLEKILLEFPLRGIDIDIAPWLQVLPLDNPIISELANRVMERAGSMHKMRQYTDMLDLVVDSQHFAECAMAEVKLGNGTVKYTVSAQAGLFYRALSEQCGMEIDDEFGLMASMRGLAEAKREYDKLSAALNDARTTGYGVVSPTLGEMTLEDPQIIKQGTRFGVRLRASAPSLHIMQVDIQAEVNPIVGTEQQSEEMVKYLLAEFETNPQGIWETNMFGKSLHAMVNESINNKLAAMPGDTQKKMRRTLARVINEGKGGVICILL